MRDGLQCGKENQHVVAGEGPCGDVGHRAEHYVLVEEVHIDADGGKSLDDRRDLAVVQVDPDNRGHDAGDGVGQEVAQTETGDMLDHERVDDDGQRQCGDDHDRHLNQGVEQHPADAGPEVAGSNSILEVLESYEFIDQLATAVCATALGDLTEEAGIDGPDDGQDEHESEQDGERCHERPAGAVLALLSAGPLRLGGGTPRCFALRLSSGCSHNTKPVFAKNSKTNDKGHSAPAAIPPNNTEGRSMCPGLSLW